jgi:hypothetical protein
LTRSLYSAFSALVVRGAIDLATGTAPVCIELNFNVGC